MNVFFDAVKKLPDYKRWKAAIESSEKDTVFTGLSPSAKAHFACLFETCGRIVYVTANELEASKRYADFCFLHGEHEERVILLPAREDMLYDIEARGREGNLNRMAALKRLLDGDWDILVLPIRAALQFLPAPEALRGQTFFLRPGDVWDLPALTDRLTDCGYERVSTVEGWGQFALRGDILDVFPSTSPRPLRIEFFGDEIDSIRYFDTLSQRTTEPANQIGILPDSETNIFSVAAELKIRKRIQEATDAECHALAGSGHPEQARHLLRRVEADLDQMAPGRKFPGYDRYLPFIIGQESTVFDYTGKACLFIDNKNETEEAAAFHIEEHKRVCLSIREKAAILSQCFGMLMPADLFFKQGRRRCGGISFLSLFSGGEVSDEMEVPVKLSDPFPEGLNNTPARKILILAESKSKAERTVEYLHSMGKEQAVFVGERISHGSDFELGVAVGALENGFCYPGAGIAVISGKSFFKKEKSKTRARKKSKPLTSFADIQKGDLVVHDVHGIGRFDGIETIESNGTKKDYVKILYADDGVIYVPTYQLESVQKFIGTEGKSPKINKLGGAEWNRTKAKIKDSLREYAKEMVELYAKRSRLPGHAFGEDTVWQREFENSFEYEETDDQLKCSEEIKADMELARPMERLLCGDVGYGKTEVALRAAFKAVEGGKQVAFLVPTTVLAQQHYQNFLRRFQDFPVTVDYLCRFRTPKERSRIMAETAQGKVDVLIGTHSVLQKGLSFRDLGLVIVDEEQRFGVRHKETLKMRYPTVDILSLSATPIPRTLHMSLSGIRDISILEEPPVNRCPVQTFVSELTPEIVKNAVYREMGRRGQVFYLYNRVRTIEEKKMWLRTIVPEARIGVAHGQMSERQLEDVMAAFLNGDYDILLCTTIIESGLDMPNVNTVIVEDGDRLGLAQLYQIRGRVGRSSKTAYAYITYQKNKNISETAEKRLQTIREFTEFGSGFKIALRDLEIRGAGSVLGEKQHGQLSVVGYDMYCKLLAEVVAEAGGEAVVKAVEVTVNIDADAFVPAAYIEDEETRLDIYQKIAQVQSEEDISELTDELIDRFGDVPQEVLRLMKISHIRYKAGLCGFGEVSVRAGKMIFLLAPETVMGELRFLPDMMTRYRGKLLLNAGTEPYLSLPLASEEPNAVLREISVFIDACAALL